MSNLSEHNPNWRARAESLGIDLNRLPRHIAMIMDGNGRWAQARGLPRLIGHINGHRTVRRMVYGCAELGIEALSLYTFSTENWRRPAEEVQGLMAMLARSTREELPIMARNGVRILFSGRLHELSPELQSILLRAQELTARNRRITLHLAINYGGRAELVDAVRAIARKIQQGKLQPDAIDEATIQAHLYQPDLPDPDLLIRTAGEQRVSNFLLWQTAYTELYITPVLWPDFDMEHLLTAIADYQSRQRKFGMVPEATPVG
ncbi:Ditrans,polycis-undecaprenyl-diphosphate synthase ((2E,6E)-farnesyl-diphosphate specific) [bacterium HR15]|nr:Ditrans,polycis-undecaprenyl-diphosphate synthase ((2E,6E)-farnesyl-diphosphate specific) [bacterium HR15]